MNVFAGVYKLDAGLRISDVRLQAKLSKMISCPTYSAPHNAKHSVLETPNTNQFPNGTQSTLNLLMASRYGTCDLGQIKANITAHFEPQTIALSGAKRLMVPLASKALATTDHG